MKRQAKRILLAAFFALTVALVVGIGLRYSAFSAAALTYEPDFNGKQMPTDMLGPHTWWAAQAFPGGITADHATAGTVGATVAGLATSVAHTNGTLTLDGDDDVVIVPSGAAATINLPSTPLVGKTYKILHLNGTVATTIVALGAGSGFSINGAASNNSLDATADMAFVVGESTGWSAGLSNH